MGPLTPGLLVRTVLFSGGINRGSAGQAGVRPRTARHNKNLSLLVKWLECYDAFYIITTRGIMDT